MNEKSPAMASPITFDCAASRTDGSTVRFEECIGCPDMGIKCTGGNLALLTIPELRIWANKWRKVFKLSVAQCAKAWDQPEGSVSRFLSGDETDFRYSTVHGIINGIVRYGCTADQQRIYISCPATSAQIEEQLVAISQQLAQKTEECAELTVRKLERANEFTERMAEQRENYEKHMAEKTETIDFLRTLIQKLQKDLDKSEAVSQNYLDRIDKKNALIAELNAEIRRLNADALRQASNYAADTKATVDRVIQIAVDHAADFRMMHNASKVD